MSPANVDSSICDLAQKFVTLLLLAFCLRHMLSIMDIYWYSRPDLNCPQKIILVKHLVVSSIVKVFFYSNQNYSAVKAVFGLKCICYLFYLLYFAGNMLIRCICSCCQMSCMELALLFGTSTTFSAISCSTVSCYFVNDC